MGLDYHSLSAIENCCLVVKPVSLLHHREVMSYKGSKLLAVKMRLNKALYSLLQEANFCTSRHSADLTKHIP